MVKEALLGWGVGGWGRGVISPQSEFYKFVLGRRPCSY